ncbi:MAG TPA: uracil-DNA glycosylase [Usitatibacter sp.]|nr:uracil-DNA glycosylase [Usitatibacter sp.]
MRSKRILRALELAPVAALYGLVEERSAPSGRLDASEEPRVIAAPMANAGGTVASMGWTELREAVRTCAACVLCRQRKQAVFGVGSESGPWLFIGEGPGADEDEQGDPFVGQAGKLLDAMLAAIGIARGREAYIANVVKCRPPGNRTPTPEEAAACAPFLDRQVELIRPRLIVALGKTAAIRLLATEASLASLRGRVHSYRGTPLVVTYHPAYLLRNLPDKAKAWEDLLFARRTLAAAA